jgi:myo-inositol-1(or 4)-monophosphatase
MSATSSYIKVCEKAVRAGGDVLLDKWGRVSVREKGRADLVTEADLASQDVVSQTIRGAFADHLVIGEEDACPHGQDLSDAARRESVFRWYVDPLDGTTNYVHQVPHFCVSLALEHSGRLLVGAVYDPVAEECYTAVAGEGAWLNGCPIRTSEVVRSSQALAAVGFPAEVRADSPDLVLFLEAIKHCQAIRRTGSAALNLCYVASGRYDAYWCCSTKAWDIAAGVLVIREAGGTVTSPDGGPLVLETGQFLAAATGKLHAELRAMAARVGLG